MNGNPAATITPPAEAPLAGLPPGERGLVTLLQLTAAADRVVAGVRREPLTDGARALVANLGAAVAKAWEVLGPERRMAATGPTTR